MFKIVCKGKCILLKLLFAERTQIKQLYQLFFVLFFYFIYSCVVEWQINQPWAYKPKWLEQSHGAWNNSSLLSKSLYLSLSSWTQPLGLLVAMIWFPNHFLMCVSFNSLYWSKVLGFFFTFFSLYFLKSVENGLHVVFL